MGERIISGRDDDGELIAAALAGDLAAFESLVRRHQKKMMGVAFQITGDYDEACEAVQDAFIAAYKNLKRFRAEAERNSSRRSRPHSRSPARRGSPARR